MRPAHVEVDVDVRDGFLRWDRRTAGDEEDGSEGLRRKGRILLCTHFDDGFGTISSRLWAPCVATERMSENQRWGEKKKRQSDRLSSRVSASHSSRRWKCAG